MGWNCLSTAVTRPSEHEIESREATDRENWHVDEKTASALNGRHSCVEVVLTRHLRKSRHSDRPKKHDSKRHRTYSVGLAVIPTR